MHIVFAHNYYQQKGGEDTVVQQEMALLRSAGHKVSLYSRHNDDIEGLLSKLKVVFTSSYSKESRKMFEKYLCVEKPDIVHVHNFFPLLTPSIYDACKSLGVPVVQTLHNFRITCAGGLLMRDNQICELCIKGSPYQAALHGCYRNSKFGSAVLAHMISKHKKLETWNKKVDRIIALTEFSKNKFIEAGISAENISVKPNFINDPLAERKIDLVVQRQGALYVGRLSHEKGIDVLLSAWGQIDYPLTIVGDGPLRQQVEQCGLKNVRYMGQLNSDEVSEEMLKAAFLVMPSIWYEGFPMVLVEAFAHGLPVVASRIGNLAEIVSNGNPGRLFNPKDPSDLVNSVACLTNDCVELVKMQYRARSVYESMYSSNQNLLLMENIYNDVIE